MAFHFDIQNVFCYSGGTEATAMFPKVAETLISHGFEIHKLSNEQNPVYAVKFDENQHPIICFSKTYFDIFSIFIILGLYVPVFIVCFPLFFERPLITAVTSHQYFNRSKVLRAFFIWLFLLLLPIVLCYAVDSKGSSLSIQFDSVKLLLSVIAALCFVPFQCFAEELFFRAYLMQGFYLFFKKPIFIVFVSSLLY